MKTSHAVASGALEREESYFITGKGSSQRDGGTRQNAIFDNKAAAGVVSIGLSEVRENRLTAAGLRLTDGGGFVLLLVRQ